MKKYPFELQKRLRAIFQSNTARTVFQAVLTLCSLVALVVLWAYDALELISLVIVIGSYLFLTLLVFGILQFLDARRLKMDEAEVRTAMQSVTLDFLLTLRDPVQICDENGRTVWYNRAFNERLCTERALYGVNVAEICTENAEKFDPEPFRSGRGVAIKRGAYSYCVRSYRLNRDSKNKRYLVYHWADCTEEAALADTMARREPAVAYIVIDNLEEMLQFQQGEYRAITTEIVSILQRWVESIGGVLKEYERDKFLLLCESEQMDRIENEKFPILDAVREVQAEDSDLHATVSIGVAHIGGSLQEKERIARETLELALQRGGDQAAVRRPTGIEFYGGRSKTVQKRTKVRARVIANELMRQIREASNVLVMGHRSADYDALGACVGIARLAMFAQKKVNILLEFSYLNIERGVEAIRELPDYRYLFIDETAAKDAVREKTLLVVVDANYVGQFACPDLASMVSRCIIIDHHRKTVLESNLEPVISYIEPSSSSTCELIVEMMEQILPAATLEQQEADLLLSGMILDTKHFTHSTGVRTFGAVMYLRSEGADPATAEERFFQTNLEEFRRVNELSRDIRVYRGMVAFAVCEGEDFTDADRATAAKVADQLLKIDKIQATFAICGIGDRIHISARSQGEINVQLILERLGGGGHFDAAGAQLRDVGTEEAVRALERAIDAYLKER